MKINSFAGFASLALVVLAIQFTPSLATNDFDPFAPGTNQENNLSSWAGDSSSSNNDVNSITGTTSSRRASSSSLNGINQTTSDGGTFSAHAPGSQESEKDNGKSNTTEKTRESVINAIHDITFRAQQVFKDKKQVVNQLVDSGLVQFHITSILKENDLLVAAISEAKQLSTTTRKQDDDLTSIINSAEYVHQVWEIIKADVAYIKEKGLLYVYKMDGISGTFESITAQAHLFSTAIRQKLRFVMTQVGNEKTESRALVASQGENDALQFWTTQRFWTTLFATILKDYVPQVVRVTFSAPEEDTLPVSHSPENVPAALPSSTSTTSSTPAVTTPAVKLSYFEKIKQSIAAKKLLADQKNEQKAIDKEVLSHVTFAQDAIKKCDKYTKELEYISKNKPHMAVYVEQMFSTISLLKTDWINKQAHFDAVEFKNTYLNAQDAEKEDFVVMKQEWVAIRESIRSVREAMRKNNVAAVKISVQKTLELLEEFRRF